MKKKEKRQKEEEEKKKKEELKINHEKEKFHRDCNCEFKSVQNLEDELSRLACAQIELLLIGANRHIPIIKENKAFYNNIELLSDVSCDKIESYLEVLFDQPEKKTLFGNKTCNFYLIIYLIINLIIK